MSLASQGRALAGCKAFTGVRPRQVPLASNGTKVFMRRRDSFMVEVNVGEDEPEDIAVRKFMKKIVDVRLIEQLRARRYLETPKEERKRRLKERIEARKLGVVQATWEEEYGVDPEYKAFNEFFSRDPDAPQFEGAYAPAYDDMSYLESAGQYMDPNMVAGGYINQGFEGGYAAAPYAQQGGYIAQPQQQTYTEQQPQQ